MSIRQYLLAILILTVGHPALSEDGEPSPVIPEEFRSYTFALINVNTPDEPVDEQELWALSEAHQRGLYRAWRDGKILTIGRLQGEGDHAAFIVLCGGVSSEEFREWWAKDPLMQRGMLQAEIYEALIPVDRFQQLDCG